MKQPTATGIPSLASSLRPAKHRAATLLFALASSAWLVACGPEIIDPRADGGSTGASTGAGGDTCGGGCKTSSSGLITTSGTHSCAVTASGALRCWGWNATGQLGDGTKEWRLAPVDVVGLSSGVVAVTGGVIHTCALMSSGAVACWGDGHLGQLGDGTTSDRLAPLELAGSSSLSNVAVGGAHTCAITAQGAARCWGYNGVGQVGNGTTADSHAPDAVMGLSTGVAAIATGNLHSCAVTSSGSVKCWGFNERGQLGDGSPTTRLAPIDVVGLSPGVVELAASYAGNCALTSSGAVQCWGENLWGQPVNGPTTDISLPVDIVGLAPGVVTIAAGSRHACALTSSGAVQCWGGNQWGQLGNDSTTDSAAPVDVVGLASGVVAIAAGGGSTCALLSSGGVKCWGYNDYGALGDGTTTARHVPVDVVGF